MGYSNIFAPSAYFVKIKKTKENEKKRTLGTKTALIVVRNLEKQQLSGVSYEMRRIPSYPVSRRA